MPSDLMRVRLLVVGLLVCLCAVFGLSPAAHANWRRTLFQGILPAVVKRAAVSLIQRELYDLEDPDALPQGVRRSRPLSSAEERDPYAPRPEWRFASPGNGPDSAATSGKTSTGHRKQHPVISHLNYLPSEKFTQASPGISRNSAEWRAFMHANASHLDFDQLVSSGVFTVDPLHGSVFKREGSVKYIILHSTETGSPADGKRVIQSWNNRGLRHPGAQFVVDRDGTIYSTTNPDMATVHINIHKTLPGYSNDNSVGIEIVRSGKQQYTQPQLNSVMYLVAYLQGHYHVQDDCVTTHHHVQPSDRSDPVGFDLAAFQSAKRSFTSALAHSDSTTEPVFSLQAPSAPGATTYNTGVTANRANRTTSSAPRTILVSGHRMAKHPQPLAEMPRPAPDFRRN